MNKKHLNAQLARHGWTDWKKSDTAYATIQHLTAKYNSIQGGKWNQIMDAKPRKLPVFDPISHSGIALPIPQEVKPLQIINAKEYQSFAGSKPLSYGLGYQSAAISLAKGSSVTYEFQSKESDSVRIELSLIPNHPVEGNQIRYSISVNQSQAQIIPYQSEIRSEAWKQQVFNQSCGS